MDYQLAFEGAIIRTADNACIPTDLDNRDYIEYIAWLDEGNTPVPAPVPAPATLPEP